jgi:hypothetical protein
LVALSNVNVDLHNLRVEIIKKKLVNDNVKSPKTIKESQTTQKMLDQDFELYN